MRSATLCIRISNTRRECERDDRRNCGSGTLRPEIETFIGEMVERHGFDQAELESIFGMAQFQPSIINAISDRLPPSHGMNSVRCLLPRSVLPMALLSGIAMPRRWSGRAGSSVFPRKSSSP